MLEEMLMREETYSLQPEFLKNQPNISVKMREILIDWLIEVCEEFMLKRETLYASISYIDRYL